MSLERLKTRYTGQTAATYNQRKHEQAHWWAEQDITARMLAGIASEQRRSVRVLDIPVGTGRFLSAYRELGMQAVGYDISADMLDEARREAERLRYSPELREANITSLPLENGAVDVVVCMRFLNHLEFGELERVLAELVRVTRLDLIATAGSRTGRARAKTPASKGAGPATLSVSVERTARLVIRGLKHPVGAVRSLIRRTSGKSGYTVDDVLAVFARHRLTIKEQATITDERRPVTDEKREYFIFHLRKASPGILAHVE